jgi:hypothetical protein
LDGAFPRAAAALGYADLVLKFNSIKKQPRPNEFETASFPALTVRAIALNRRGVGASPKQMVDNARSLWRRWRTGGGSRFGEFERAAHIGRDQHVRQPACALHRLSDGLDDVVLCAFDLGLLEGGTLVKIMRVLRELCAIKDGLRYPSAGARCG